MTPPYRGKDTGSSISCFCCGKTGHGRANCRFKDMACHGCGKTGHLIKVCRSQSITNRGKSKPPGKKTVHLLEESSEGSSEEEGNYGLYAINSSSKPQPYRTSLVINGKSVLMEIDTGASLTLVSEHTFWDCWPKLNLAPSGITLHSYPGESIPVMGTVKVSVEYGGQETTLPLLVVRGEGPSLLGRNWLCELKLNWHDIFWLHNASLNQVL